MKRHLLLLIVFCLGKICQAQIVSQILLVENNTAHRYFFSRCVSDFSSSLMIKDTSFYSNIVQSNSSKFAYSDFKKIQNYYNKYVNFDYKKEQIAINSVKNKNETFDKIWIELTYYQFDISTNKIKYIGQLLFLFEGTNPEKEMYNPKILNIKLIKKKSVINRDSYILAQKHKKVEYDNSEEPIKYEEINTK